MQARIHSIPVLKQLRASLTTFASVASVALDEANSEIQRTLLWLREDQYRYWKGQLQARTDEYGRAKRALKQREVLDRALAGSRSSAVDEKRALKVAERRLREAEHKLRMVRTWSRQLEKEVLDYKGAIQGLLNATEAEIPNACARLDKMMDSLEKYVAVAPPEALWSTGEGTETSVRRAPEGSEQVSALFRMQQKAKMLRSATPSAETRRKAALDDNWEEGISWLRLSDALIAVAEENTTEPVEAGASDRVVIARPQEDGEVFYLERTQSEDGDSGWYFGLDEDAESVDLFAVEIGDLLRVRPEMTGLLRLPTGYLVLVDGRAGLEAVFDPDDNMVWWSTEQPEYEVEAEKETSRRPTE